MSDVVFKDLCIDVTERPGAPAAVAEFWRVALGLEVVVDGDDDVHLVGDAPNRTVWINNVPEALDGTSRVHVDVPAGGDASTAILTVEAADPVHLATWWAERAGGTVDVGSGGATLTGMAGFPYGAWMFTESTEPKRVKNPVHWDVLLADATVADLVAAGATLLREPDDEIRWWVLADAEGNEFCAFRPS